MNNSKKRVDDLDINKLKTVPVDLKKLCDVMDNEINKKTKFKALKTKVNRLKKKILDVTTLIQVNQYNTVNQSLAKKLEIHQIRVVW